MQSPPGGGTAHPRSRGEHKPLLRSLLRLFGSSPLARGTRVLSPAPPAPGRLIPARAGNTRVLCLFLRSESAHPRSRGEHGIPLTRHRHQLGSSPLARGTHSAPTLDWVGARLIPARAGNTAASCFATISQAAHPRSRGEHGVPVARVVHAYGSSPLARGTRCSGRISSLPRRLIPARAGNTSSCS